jgi:hypothetical protein
MGSARPPSDEFENSTRPSDFGWTQTPPSPTEIQCCRIARCFIRRSEILRHRTTPATWPRLRQCVEPAAAEDGQRLPIVLAQ